MKLIRNYRTRLEHIIIGKTRRDILHQHNWRKSSKKNWTSIESPFDLTRSEIIRLTPAQLDYKLLHGVTATPPDIL